MSKIVAKNQNIEALRAVAILLVVITHANKNLINWSSSAIGSFFHYFDGGVGVDLFFTISGFVIARSFLLTLSEAESGPQRIAILKAFWVRRIFRIFPLAWFWLSVILLATVFLNSSGAFRSWDANWWGTVTAVLQVANFRFHNCFMQYDCGVNFVYWSLSLEEQFYILLPICALLLRQWLILFFSIVLLTQFFIPPWFLPFSFRVDGLLLGVMLAYWAQKDSYLAYKPHWIGRYKPLCICIIAVCLFVLSLCNAPAYRAYLGVFNYKVIALISFFLVWVGSYDSTYISLGRRMNVLLSWIGSRSFSLYLAHIPVFYLTREFWFLMSGSQVPASDAICSYIGLCLFLLLVCSEFSYRLVEVPLRSRGIFISQKILHRVAAPELERNQLGLNVGELK
jgi:peptidoglycan/LPS O-acetylase OafA/YrhL